MKQNITFEQKNELSEKGARALQDWALSKRYWTPSTVGWPALKEDLPILTIGQMVEFLDGHKINWSKCAFNISSGGRTEWIRNGVGEMPRYDPPESSPSVNRKRKELCDALWEAVKEVLEK